MKVLIVLQLAFVLLVGPAVAQTFRAKDLKDCEQVQGDADRAIQACCRVIQAFDNKNVNSTAGSEILASAFFHRSKAYGAKRDFQRQIQDLDQDLALKPTFLAFYERGWAYREIKEYERAIHDFDQALTNTSDSAPVLYGRGTAYSEKRDYEKAIKDFDEALKIKPSFHQALGNRGNAYRLLGNYDRAIQDYDQAIQIKPDYAIGIKNEGSPTTKAGSTTVPSKTSITPCNSPPTTWKRFTIAACQSGQLVT